ncbi:hypothetical protein ACFLSF_04305 [Candidatus Bipolaricaulota bacterium]
MSLSYAHCRRCLLPVGKFNVRLDASGLCNYCRHWDETKASVLDIERNRPLLVDRLERYRGRLHYDAAVGLSGGKDSTYVLHRLVTTYDANVLAITFDNGFLTDYAWRNIRDISQTAGVDHLVYRPDWNAYAPFYRAALAKLGDPCAACSIGGYILSVRGCRGLRIPFFVHGRSPMQMFRHWYPGTRDLGVDLLRGNLAEHSVSALRREYRSIIRRLRLLLLYLVPNPGTRRLILRELIGDGLLRGELVPEFLAFFLFEPYDEVAIVDHLEALNVGYRRPENHVILGHGDCLIHDAAADLYERHHGVSRVLPDVAAMLRQGAITQEEAAEILAANTPSEEDVEVSVRHMLERIGMPRTEYDRVLARLSRKRGWMPSG